MDTIREVTVNNIDAARLRKPDNRAVVSALDRLLTKISVDDLLQFLAELNIKFSLATEGGDDQRKQFFYRARIFKQTIEDKNLKNIFCYSSSGKMPQIALRNAIAEMVVCENVDFHDYLNFK